LTSQIEGNIALNKLRERERFVRGGGGSMQLKKTRNVGLAYSTQVTRRRERGLGRRRERFQKTKIESKTLPQCDKVRPAVGKSGSEPPLRMFSFSGPEPERRGKAKTLPSLG